MNYKNFFVVHPLYKLISEQKILYEKKKFEGDSDTYLSISVIFKK